MTELQAKQNNLVSSSKWLLAILYFLNCTDILFTLLFNQTGFFVELNPFMNSVISNISVAIGLKLVLPAILFCLLSYRIKSATISQLKTVKICLMVISVVYVLINALHIVTLITYCVYDIV